MLEQTLYKNFSHNTKIQEVILKSSEQSGRQDLHAQVRNSLDYPLSENQTYGFGHAQTFNVTHVIMIYAPELPSYIKNDKDKLRKALDNISQYAFNTQYMEKILMTQNLSPDPTLRKSESMKNYLKFLQDMCKLLYKKKNILDLSDKDIHLGESLESSIKDNKKLLKYDFLNDSTLAITVSLSEVIDRLTDSDEIQNCIILNSHSFIHPSNWLLSPAALALSFFNSQIIDLKKPKNDEPYYTKATLPRVSYLSLTGILSEMDINVLNRSSENIQIVSIYDENTGGPTILRDDRLVKVPKKSNLKIDFQDTSNKLLLLPLKCKKNSDGSYKKEYTSNGILQLIEYAVIPSLTKFRPSYIVLNVSLIFDAENQTPFSIDTETLGYIVHLLGKLADCKVIVFPFKIPNMKEPEIKDCFEEAKKHIEDKEEQERLDSILDRYGVPYNEVYLRNSIVRIFEVLSDQCDLTLFNRLRMRKMYKINPLIHNMCYQIGRFYKNHPYYKFLYSKTLNTLAKVVAQGLISIDELPLGHEKEINSLVLHFPDPTGKKVSEVKKILLQVSDKPRGEIVLTKDSQYIVDYNEKGIPTVYIFNARRYEEDEQLRVKTSKEFGHYSVSFEMEEAQYVVADYKHISLEGNEEEDVMKDCGLCKGEEFIFQVYGINVSKNEESNRIRYFDLVKQEMFSIALTEEQKAMILKRHSVTACAYKKDNTYYLYVFGGQIKSATTYKGKVYGSLDIFDIVEVYQTDDPRSGKWEYTLLEKDNICENAVSFIPYNKSFGWYDKDNDKILIIGGKTFENSIYNWTCPVFEFDVEKSEESKGNKNRFTSFQLFLNHIKDNPNRKPIENNSYKAPFMTTAIASSNPNIYFDSKSKVYKFIIPLEYEDIICIFSYNQKTTKCDYRETQIQPSVIKIKGSLLEKTISNPDRVGKKPIVINPRVATLLNYSFPYLTHRKVLLKLTEWRMKQDAEILASGPIQTEWVRIINDTKKHTTDPEDKKELEIDLFDWASFREFEDIFMKKDNRLEKLREYLTTQICLSILKILEDILLFKEFIDSVADKISGKIEKKIEDSFKSISTGSNSQSGKSFSKDETTNFKKKTFEYMKTLIQALQRYRDTQTLDNDDFDTLIAEGSKLESELDLQLSLSKIDSASNPESFSSVISEFKDSFLQNVMEGSTELMKKLKRRTEYSLRTDTSNLNSIINELMNLVRRNIDFFQIEVDPNNIFGEEVPAKYEPIIKATKILELYSAKGEQVVIKYGGLEWQRNSMELELIRDFLDRVNNELKALAESGYDPTPIQGLIDKGVNLSAELKEGSPIKDLAGYLVESLRLLADSQERTQIDQNIIKDLKRSLESLSDQLGDESTRADSTIQSRSRRRPEEEKHIDAANTSSFLSNSMSRSFMGNTSLDNKAGYMPGMKNVLADLSIVEEESGKAEKPEKFEKFEKLEKPERQLEKAPLETIPERVAIKPVQSIATTSQYTQTSDTRPFKECLSASRTDRIMYNSSRSELVLAVGDQQEYKIKTRFRFAVVRRDHDLQKPVLETFSLDHSPSSVYVMGEAVVCFIDKKTKTRYPDLYGDYGSFIMFADMKFGVLPSPYGEDVKFLVFNKLFQVTQDDHIYQRSLVVTENFIVLFGGKSLKMKTNTIKNHSEILVYSVEKYSFGQVDSKFKVTDVDSMNNNGECIAIGYGKFIYVCKRESPSDLEIFTEDGISVEKVELPESHKNHTVSLSIVNIKDKDKILLTFSLRDKDRKFMLFDIKKKAFEEGEEIKIKRKNKGEDDEFGFLCSGFEEFDINSNISQGKNEVLLYNYRDIGEINICNVETT